MENKYYLAINPKPNNYFPINLLDLKISKGYNTFSLEELDNFTLKYTLEEIKEAIREANLFNIDKDTKIVVIYYEKEEIRSIPALTLDINFNMWENIKENFNNKDYRNKIYNFLKNKTKINIDVLKKEQAVEEYILNITKLPYILQRKLYFYLYERV